MADRSERDISFTMELDELDETPEALRRRAARELRAPLAEIPELEVRKRSIDARKGRVRVHFVVGLAPTAPIELAAPAPRQVDQDRRVVIVGAGPAGLFCAYELARRGIGAIVLDRGKPVQARRRDLKGLQQHGVVDPDSNYCFGEGGAGTYSDGKLYTRSHKRGDVRDVLEILALHGAPARILIDARPHIGSNKLPKVISAMRERLVRCGVEVRFGARVDELITERRGGQARVAGVRLADGTELSARAVVIATGHSARDVFEMLDRAGAPLAAKPFAMGVRIEHPQPLIDRIQYGAAAGHPALPAASYKLAHSNAAGGVYSFCMCPGGWVVPASTEPDALVVNGMSLSRRDSPFANSGLVVSLAGEQATDWRSGVALQQRLEQAAFAAGGGALRAPATRVTDFVAGRGSTSVPASSYIPGLHATDVGEVLEVVSPQFADHLRAALRVFERRMRGYITDEAVVIGVESRTSAPVRALRDPQALTSPAVDALYLCGEGAGYAGGIASAAVDGMRIARAVALSLGSRS